MRNKWYVMLAMLLAAAAAQSAVLLDNFSGDLSKWTSTTILDNNGGARNTKVWEISDGKLQLRTTAFDGIEQYALIYDGLGLAVGQELQVDFTRANLQDQDLGLYVGGTAPADNIRRDYVAMYARNNGQVFSRGFDGTTEYGLVGDWGDIPLTSLFIMRVDDNTFETGYYIGDERTVLVTRTPAFANKATHIGIYADVRQAGTLGYLDNFRIWSDVLVAHNPVPANGAEGLDPLVTFSWYKARDPNDLEQPNPSIDSHILNYVAWEIDDAAAEPNFLHPNAVAVAVDDMEDPVTSPQIAFSEDKRVFWRVDHVLSEGDPIIGPVWQFSTVPSEADISTQPQDTGALAGQETSFAVAFESYSPADVAWFKVVDDGPDMALTDSFGAPVDPLKHAVQTDLENVIHYTSTLTVKDVSLSDEGLYYCVISNESPEDTESGRASLKFYRLLAQYLFNGDLTDAVGDNDGQGRSVAGQAEPNELLATPVALGFGAGVDGTPDSAVILASSEQYIDFGAAAFPKAGTLPNGTGAGLDEGTILCWIKPDVTTMAYGNILGTYNDGTTTGFSFGLPDDAADTANVRFHVRGETLAGEYDEIGEAANRPDRPGWDIFDGNWHLVGATWKQGESITIYVDGQWVGSNAVGTAETFADWEKGVLLGASRVTANRLLLTNFTGGAFDNLRIYNYRMDADSIAQEYLDATGVQPCVNMTFVGNYYNTDNTGSSYCRVDLADFADFAAAWLADGLY